MSNHEVFYVIDGQGRYKMEVPNADGGFDYVAAEPGLAFIALPNGKFMAVRDTAEAERQKEMTSHERYFESLQKDAKGDPKEVRQQFRRQEALQRKLQVVAINRVEAPAAPNVRTITDEQASDYLLKYQAAIYAGTHKESDFQPINAYESKLTTKSGKVLRPLYKGEIGMDGSDILVLEAGYGTGSQVDVK